MATQCEMFMNYSKNFKGICKKKYKYDCQTWNTKGTINVKEQIWLTNVKYLRLSTLYGHYTHMCTVSNVIGISAETQFVCKTRNT